MLNIKEMKVFAGFLHESMETRLVKLGDILRKDEKYQKFCDEKLEIFKQIVFNQTDNSNHLLLKYLDKELEISNVAQARAYELGFKDAIMLILFAGMDKQELADLLDNLPGDSETA